MTYRTTRKVTAGLTESNGNSGLAGFCQTVDKKRFFVVKTGVAKIVFCRQK